MGIKSVVVIGYSISFYAVLFYVIFILLGRPIENKIDPESIAGSEFKNSVLCAYFLSVLVTFPLIVYDLFSFGENYNLLLNNPMGYVKRIYELLVQFQAKSSTEICLCVASCCAIFGAWIGTIPMMLDLRDPWQNWPVPVMYGALIGWGCSGVVSGVVLLLKN